MEAGLGLTVAIFYFGQVVIYDHCIIVLMKKE